MDLKDKHILIFTNLNQIQLTSTCDGYDDIVSYITYYQHRASC